MYSFVDVTDYSIVGIGETMQTAHDDYLRKLKTANKQISGEVAEMRTVTGTVAAIAFCRAGRHDALLSHVRK